MFVNRAAKKVAFAGLAILGALEGAQAIFTSDIGKNEWHLETLGEISDMIMFADN